MSYGYLTDVRGSHVTYDKVDYLKAACEARTKPEDIVQTARADAICFRNVNAALRHAPLSTSAVVTVVSEVGRETRLRPVDLGHYVKCCSGPNMWRITLRRGVIVSLYQFNVAGG